ncbi:WGR domain-containing protein (plasmid) [Phormidium sp. CLA17]|uniref:WGR domain-containing protein n=1 Tax=Leptolyngbya sp. Cla-17 TaxID=2803751 RepID=UPI0014917E64|nr:WGR domain-containing protein [Leptolyngbya sp. Cla-17]MBM0745005.1 WGR domain-containing protein [Leptolyngbya sp. Cla-17]
MTTRTRPDLSKAIRTVKLICVNATTNSNKQWAAWVLSDGTLYVEYGRVNYAQKPHVYSCRSVALADNKLNQLLAEKRNKGYRPVQVEDQPQIFLDFNQLGSDYAETVREKIDQLASMAEPVINHTAIRFDRDRGVFVTQMGTVSRQTLTQATMALQKIKASLNGTIRRGYESSPYLDAVEQYLSTVPLPIGMKLEARQVLGNLDQITQQFGMLQTLEGCLGKVEEIRIMIEQAIAGGGAVGSDERARWLNWGATEEITEMEEQTALAADERACWVRW